MMKSLIGFALLFFQGINNLQQTRFKKIKCYFFIYYYEKQIINMRHWLLLLDPNRQRFSGVQKRNHRADFQPRSGPIRTGNRPTGNELRPNNGPTKVSVTNLAPSVSENDVQELFSEFGGFISAAMHFDRVSLFTFDTLLYFLRVVYIYTIKWYRKFAQ